MMHQKNIKSKPNRLRFSKNLFRGSFGGYDRERARETRNDGFERRVPEEKRFCKTKRYISYSIPLACIMAFLVSLVILPSGKAHAALSATLEIDGSTSGSTISGTAEPGGTAYAKSNVKYVVSDTSGWSLKVSYASGKNSLSMSGGTTMSGTNTTTGVTPANMANNTWGYAWSDSTSPTQSSLSYKTMPAYGSPAEMKTGTANVSTTGSINFAAKFATDAVSGHYKTEVMVSLVATPPLVTYTLTFDKNTTDTVSGMPANQNCQTTDSSCSITISSATPTRTGYDFQGWSTSSGASNSVDVGTSITVSANKTIYAVWQAQGPAVSGFGGITQMQQMTSATCTNAAANTSGQLYDTRDNTTYTVAKLADGKCWMTQNLRLTRESIKAKTSTNTTGKLTNADSNVGTGTLTATGNGYEIPASITTGFSSAQSGDYYTNQQVYVGGDNDYGAYYSYNVATVNTVAASASGTAQYDICPKGWRLPTGGPSGEFQTLYSKYSTPTGLATYNTKYGYWLGGAAGTTTNPASNGGAFFPAAGSIRDSGPINTASYGFYWSSTIESATQAYDLDIYYKAIYPADSSNRYYGFSVRCVAK